MKRLLYVLLIFGSVSCSFLDTEPIDFSSPETFYTNKDEVEMALRGVYASLAGYQLYGDNMLGRMGLTADLGYDSYSVDKRTIGVYQTSTTDPRLINYWQEAYKGIGLANSLMSRMDRESIGDDDFYDSVYGQALFLRSYYHFMLVSKFNNIPLVLNVPETSKRDDLQIPQSPMSAVYEKIISDMETAAEMVDDIIDVKSPGVVSRSAVYGVLARVALYMAGYPLNRTEMYAKAKSYAQKVIDTGYHQLNPDYSRIFINLMEDKYDLKESIFEVEFYGNNQGIYSRTAGQVGRNMGIRYTNQTDNLGVSTGIIQTTKYFYDLFAEGDLRRDWTIAPYSFDSSGKKIYFSSTEIWQRYCGKFRRECETLVPKDPKYTPTNFPILRYSDVLLMWAEAVAADPDNSNADELTQAYEYVNQVRRRGYGKDINTPDPTVDFPESDKQDLYTKIKDERARELGFELLRKDDLVRWGEFEMRMKYILTTINPSFTSSYYVAARTTYSEASSRDVVWPIPSYELGVNSNLVQNSGW